MPNDGRRLLPEDPAGWGAFRWAIPERFNIAERCCFSWAEAEPDRLALIELRADGAERRWSYGELAAEAARVSGLFAAAGLGRGDRVGLLLSQGPEMLIAQFAAFRLGAVAVPLFTLFGEEALRYRLGDCAARLVVTDSDNLSKINALRGDLPALHEVFCIDGMRDNGKRNGAADFHAEPAEIPPVVDTGAEHPAVIIYTSGTTGDPKGALHAHRFLLGHLTCMEAHHEGYPAPGDVGWTPADWAWIGGLMDMAMPCLYYGVPLISHRMRKFTPEAAWELIARYGINRLFLPPTALKLMRHAPVPEGIHVRSIGSGGESLGDDLIRWGREMLGAPINEIYGQTECNLVICSTTGKGRHRSGAMGLPVPGHRVAVIDGQGNEVPPGEVGEIAVRRPDPVMFLGYWEKPGKTAEKFTGDWMRTGDLGRADADGYVTYLSRDDDVITSAGYRIGPTEIENCLCAHPDVSQAAVVGLPDPERTEAVTAFVVPRDGVSGGEALAAELVQRVRDQVGKYCAPRRVIWRQALPTTATGKVMRRALREEYAQGDGPAG